ncbi:MAG TPA: hemolysin family protein [Terriglobales bacterium]|jgi:CBS domain containing-hemolysin-like protein|nr:hemolysin family protein [Terriglobales bacterium]
MTIAFGIVLVVLLGFLTLVSYVERIHTEAGKFLSREFQENIEAYEQLVEPRLHVSKERAALAIAVLEQLTNAAVAMMIAYSVFLDGTWDAAEIAQAVLAMIIAIIVFNRIVPFVLFSRTKGEWVSGFSLLLRLLIYIAMPVTIIVSFCQSVASLAREHGEPEPEHPSEAVDAFIEAGQEEGIIEESDRDLIQSVVEFGDKTVREVMKPRPEVFAVSEDITVEQLTEMMRTRPYSRVPVYRGTIDHIVGIVVAHDVLQLTDAEARVRPVGSIMKRDVRFVPETKRVSDLLREMQRDNIRLEIVIDEYGAVAGVVTIEDMVEEIVGEIRDDHDKAEIVKESENTYVMPGSVDVDRLAKLFGFSAEDREATTVAGLVSEIAGRIPHQGEVITDDGLKFEVLESTDRKIIRVRVSPSQHKESEHQLRA